MTVTRGQGSVSLDAHLEFRGLTGSKEVFPLSRKPFSAGTRPRWARVHERGGRRPDCGQRLVSRAVCRGWRPREARYLCSARRSALGRAGIQSAVPWLWLRSRGWLPSGPHRASAGRACEWLVAAGALRGSAELRTISSSGLTSADPYRLLPGVRRPETPCLFANLCAPLPSPPAPRHSQGGRGAPKLSLPFPHSSAERGRRNGTPQFCPAVSGRHAQGFGRGRAPLSRAPLSRAPRGNQPVRPRP